MKETIYRLVKIEGDNFYFQDIDILDADYPPSLPIIHRDSLKEPAGFYIIGVTYRHSEIIAPPTQPDAVNPSHYADLAVSPIDLIGALGWSEQFALGNAIKYIARAHKKNGREDLLKATWYLLYSLGMPKDEIKKITDKLKEQNGARTKD